MVLYSMTPLDRFAFNSDDDDKFSLIDIPVMLVALVHWMHDVLHSSCGLDLPSSLSNYFCNLKASTRHQIPLRREALRRGLPC